MFRRPLLLAAVVLAVAPAAASAQRLAYAEETFDAPTIPQLRTLEPPAALGALNACCGVGPAPDWSPDGTRIAFARPAVDEPGPSDLWTVGGALTGAVNVSSTPQVDEREPSWSPDGTRLAYVADGSVYVLDLATHASTRLSPDGVADDAPAWSPVDGRLLLVRDGDVVLTRATPGAPAVKLTDRPFANAAPAWSPDGARIAWAVTDTRRGIWRMRADGTRKTRLSRGIDSHPTWSPDGKQIAFSRATPDHALLFPDHLWTMRAGGGRERAILAGGEPVLGVTPDWG